MPSLYSYIIPVDDGAAPNPFYGLCTLAICKPVIRRTAKVGDWIVGLGSKNVHGNDRSGRVVYAMEVTEIMTLKKYDELSLTRWPKKIPDTNNADHKRRLGDCIYKYDNENISQRPSVHSKGNEKTDLSGKNVLISSNYYYFGEKAVKLPSNLTPIIHQGQGHKRPSNDPYYSSFVDWITNSDFQVNTLLGSPDFTIDWNNVESCGACAVRKNEAESDKEC